MMHLVTGGSGFIGNLMCRHLVLNGESVRAIDVWEDPSAPSAVEFVNCDVRDREKISRMMRGVDVVHHMAALVTLTKSSSRQFYEVNVEGSRIVAEEAAQAGVKCFVYMSSSSIFGIPASCPINEHTVPNPVEPYGKSKLAGELAARDIAEKSGMQFIAVRPRTVIGQGRLGIFQLLFDWIRAGVDVYTIGPGNNRMQFIHVSDLISACLVLSKAGKCGSYNVGTDSYGTIRHTLEKLVAHADTGSKVRSLPVHLTVSALTFLDRLNLIPLAPLHYLSYSKDYYCDLSPMTELGWLPKYSNEQMLCDAYDSFVQNYNELMKFQAGSVHRTRINEKLLRVFRNIS